MQDKDNSDGPIMRLFEAQAKPGCAGELAQKLSSTSIDVVRNEFGNEGYLFGQTIAAEQDVFVFASIWTNLQAVKDKFGTDWQVSYLPDGYADLIEACSVRHIVLAPGSQIHLPG